MNDIKFGSINVETGESQEGYIENGEIKFHKTPWWEKLFVKPPREKVYLGIREWREMDWDFGWYTTRGVLYKEHNPLTGKVYRVYCERYGQKIDWNVDAFVHEGRLIRI